MAAGSWDRGQTIGLLELEPELEAAGCGERSMDIDIDLSAREKHERIWEILANDVRSTEGIEWPTTTTVANDIMNADYETVLTDRRDLHSKSEKTLSKTLCAHGIVYAVRIDPSDDSDYTGLFTQASYGIMRLSSALRPNLRGFGGSIDAALFPCVALKFFRQGASSGNLLFAGKKTGQPEDFFFAHSVCNHLTEKTAFLLQWILGLFKKYSAFPTQLGCSDFAKVKENGEIESQVKFPWCLNLRPLLKESDFPSRIATAIAEKEKEKEKEAEAQAQAATPRSMFSWIGGGRKVDTNKDSDSVSSNIDTTDGSSSSSAAGRSSIFSWVDLNLNDFTDFTFASSSSDNSTSNNPKDANHLNELLEIPVGTAVYEILAIRDPTAALDTTGANIECIGRVVTTSKAVFSREDAAIFFKVRCLFLS